MQNTAAGRMAPHVKAVGVLNLVVGAILLLVSLAVLLIFKGGSAFSEAGGGPGWLPGFLRGLGIGLAIIPGVLALLNFLAGALLLQHNRAGKPVGILTALLSLLSFPLGTLFGLYALWVLLQPDTKLVLSS